MFFLNKTYIKPADNIALDEAILDWCTETGNEVLRLWAPDSTFVVLGRGNKIEEEVKTQVCLANNIPILRRCSGGGTVLQAKGCLNYSVVLQIKTDPQLDTIQGTNDYILSKHKSMLTPLFPEATVHGISDLTLGLKKISGNAQKRKKNTLLFHGTFLLNTFHLNDIETYLAFPSKQPDYRENRSHLDFVTKLNLGAGLLSRLLKQAWQAQTLIDKESLSDIECRSCHLTKTVYDNEEWNWER